MVLKFIQRKKSDNTIWIISNLTRHIQKHEQNKNLNCNSIRNFFSTSTPDSTQLQENIVEKGLDNDVHKIVDTNQDTSLKNGDERNFFYDENNGEEYLNDEGNNIEDTPGDDIGEAGKNVENLDDDGEFLVEELDGTEKNLYCSENEYNDESDDQFSSDTLRFEPAGKDWDDVMKH